MPLRVSGAMRNIERWARDCGVWVDDTVAPHVESIGVGLPTLPQLEHQVRTFDGCPLLKHGAKNTVFARGDPASGLMIIGEAPGASEDANGVPFCGASGKLLDKILEAAGLINAYITNMVFWRPENNRKPSPEEVACCLPLVQQHIAVVNPKVLLLLGSTAANGLLDPTLNMTQMRLQMHREPLSYQNQFMAAPVVAMVSYHPSYLLRQPARKRDAWEDFKLVRDTLIGMNVLESKAAT
jgi:uracil-DNA glycosylase family 4